MSQPSARRFGSEAGNRPPADHGHRRMFVVGGWLLLQLLVLLGSFTTATLVGEREGWVAWMDQIDVIPRIALVFVTAFLLFGRRGVALHDARYGHAAELNLQFAIVALAQVGS